jgi:hypothetical protein
MSLNMGAGCAVATILRLLNPTLIDAKPGRNIMIAIAPRMHSQNDWHLSYADTVATGACPSHIALPQ